MSKDHDYTGDEIKIYEWPCGCEIVEGVGDGRIGILVRSPRDARAIIESLERMIFILGNVDSGTVKVAK